MDTLGYHHLISILLLSLLPLSSLPLVPLLWGILLLCLFFTLLFGLVALTLERRAWPSLMCNLSLEVQVKA